MPKIEGQEFETLNKIIKLIIENRIKNDLIYNNNL